MLKTSQHDNMFKPSKMKVDALGFDANKGLRVMFFLPDNFIPKWKKNNGFLGLGPKKSTHDQWKKTHTTQFYIINHYKDPY